MATIELKLSSKPDRQTKRAELLLRFFHGRVIDARAKTGIFISSAYWTGDSIVIKDRIVTEETKYHQQTKERLDVLCSLIQKQFQSIDRGAADKLWLEDIIVRFNFPDKYVPKVAEAAKPVTLLTYVADFIKLAPSRKDKATGRKLSPNNLQQYRATEKHLRAYAASKRKKDFEFTEINQKFYEGFVAYLQSEITEPGKNGEVMVLKPAFTANSVGKHVRILKLMLNEATSKQINTSTEYAKFHVFTEETDTVYLNEDELQTLKETDFSNSPHLDRTRDWFLMLAWTGCRFSDLEKIGQTDIKDGFITFRQQKTNTKVTIPLHPVVLEILQKYDFDLPEPITNQRFNEYVKEVAQLAEINSPETITRTVGGNLVSETHPKYKLVTSHTGHRSFCTNMYKRGLPTLMIMSISGHKTEKSFLKYIKVTQSEHAAMMAKEWQKLYGNNISNK